MAEYPFSIEDVAPNHRVVTFSRMAIQLRTLEYETALENALADVDTLAFDLSQTEVMGSQWWRWIGKLGFKAEQMGQRVAVVGASQTLRETADAVGVETSDAVVFVDKIDEAWSI